MRQELKTLMSMGKKYRTTNRNGVAVYDGMTPYRENHLMLDVSHSDSEAELRGTGQNRRTLSRRGCTR
ncbi:fimbria/pilus outer membrane usher protein [Shigella flexneri]